MSDELLKNICIREISHGDGELMNEFFDAMGAESRALFNRRDYNRRGVLKYCNCPDKTRRYWLAELDGKAVGYVFFLDWNTSVPTMGVAVRDDFQGKHIGKMLVQFAIDTVKQTGKGGIQLTTHSANLRAQMLYENMGFQCMGLCKNGIELFYLYRYLD